MEKGMKESNIEGVANTVAPSHAPTSVRAEVKR